MSLQQSTSSICEPSEWPQGTETVEISALSPYTRNARTHSRKQIRKIADSIDQFGFVNPVLIDENNQIIAGHGRVSAATLLGWASVPVLRIEHLSDAEKRAYMLADNRLAEEAGWDKEILAIELQGLIDVDFSIDLTGFDSIEVDFILDEAADAKAPEHDKADVTPSLPPENGAVPRIGDVFDLGQHRVLCGDATLLSSYETLLGRAKASLVFTDPPYNVPIKGHVSGLGKHQHREFAMASGEMSSDAFQGFLETVFGHLANHSLDGSIHYICMDCDLRPLAPSFIR